MPRKRVEPDVTLFAEHSLQLHSSSPDSSSAEKSQPLAACNRLNLPMTHLIGRFCRPKRGSAALNRQRLCVDKPLQ